MLFYCKVSRLCGLLSCTKFFSTSGLAECSPCSDALRVCCRTLRTRAKRSTQSSVKHAENIIKHELAKANLDTERIYDIHKAIINELYRNLKAERIFGRSMQALLKADREVSVEKEARLLEKEARLMDKEARLQLSKEVRPY